MDKTIRKYTDFDEMKADDYRYWQSRQKVFTGETTGTLLGLVVGDIFRTTSRKG